MATADKFVSIFDESDDTQIRTSKLKFDSFKLVWNIENFEFICKHMEVIESPRFPSENLKKGQWFLELKPTVLKDGNDKKFVIYLKSTHDSDKYVSVRIEILNSTEVVKSYVTFYPAKVPITWEAFSGSEIYQAFKKSIPQNVVIKCELSVIDTDKMLIKKPLADSLNCNDLVENIENLLDNEDFKDVMFEVEDKEFTAHKLILASRSPVFAAMFNSKMREELTSVVEIKDIKPTVFQQMLRFIYSDHVENLNESALELFYVADKYQLEKLKFMSVNSLKENLSSKSVINTLRVADLYSISDLKIECLKFVNAEWEAINETEDFKKLMQSRPYLALEILKVQKTLDDKDKEDNECFENWSYELRKQKET